MSSGRSSGDFLAARDARHEWLLAACQLARETGHGAVLLLSTNVPGPDKDRSGLERLLERGLAALAAGQVDSAPLRAGTDLLGPYRILLAREAAARVKAAAIALEDRLPGGRVLDVDVLTADGRPVDRRSLGLPPRSCYACDRPARECILLARHPLAELLAAVDTHLALAGSG
jgi:holo-ACP synthase CitX